jgi:very-short-patch-repair endonuclease
MLLNIPARNLYDRKTSIYDLCNMSFEGLVQLTEHFRCVPEIIGFSNLIAYDNPIRPLRETSRVKMVPPFVLHRVNGISSEKHNATEAEEIASLILAASEHPDYQTNDRGETVSIGVISLLGEAQALEIDKLLRKRMSPDDYQRRRILCGNPAHFQGDERDLIFLSMVDSATGDELLNLRGDGADGMYKKRFNVAVSRARDQVWVGHSLNPETNLQPNDIRRRLLDYARDPEAHKRAFETLAPRTESPFEKAVLKHLTNHGYRVHPQFAVGSYRIDFVIEYQNGRIALECDGERFHTLENLQADMERQSVLERLGWRFIRIRGSNFYRDEAKTMQRVFAQLETHGILPSGPNELTQGQVTQRNDRIEQIRRRAAEIRASWAKSNDTTTAPLNRSAPAQASQPVRQTSGVSQFQPLPEPVRTNLPVASGQQLIRQLRGQNGLITRAKLQEVLEGLIPQSDRILKRDLLATAARELEFTTGGEKRRLEVALEEVEKSVKFKSTVDAVWRNNR